MYSHLQGADTRLEQLRHLFIGTPFDVLHHERFSQRRRERRQGAIEIAPQLAPVQLFFGRLLSRRWTVPFVTEMGPPNVLQPVLAPIGHDSKHPRIEAPAHLTEVLKCLDERVLQNVGRIIRTPRHSHRVPIQRIAISNDEDRKGVLISGEDAIDDRLIGVDLVFLR